MKKALLWGAALCAMLVFMGCPTDDPEPEPDGPITPAGWKTEITLTAETGDNPGEITYSFIAAELESGTGTITYTLYYAEGSKYTAAEIKAAQPGKEDNVEPGDNIIYRTPGKTYSIVVEASAEGVDSAYSAVRSVTTKAAPPPPPESSGDLAKITITEIPPMMSDATTPNPDGVTFMLVVPSEGQQPLAYGFAVVGGTLPPGGNGVEVTEIKQDGTAEVDLYDSAEAITFLMGIMTGTPGNLPAPKSIGGSGIVSVQYAKVSEGESISIPQNTRVWMNVTFEDPLELNWSEGIDTPAQQP